MYIAMCKQKGLVISSWWYLLKMMWFHLSRLRLIVCIQYIQLHSVKMQLKFVVLIHYKYIMLSSDHMHKGGCTKNVKLLVLDLLMLKKTHILHEICMK